MIFAADEDSNWKSRYCYPEYRRQRAYNQRRADGIGPNPCGRCGATRRGSGPVGPAFSRSAPWHTYRLNPTAPHLAAPRRTRLRREPRGTSRRFTYSLLHPLVPTPPSRAFHYRPVSSLSSASFSPFFVHATRFFPQQRYFISCLAINLSLK